MLREVLFLFLSPPLPIFFFNGCLPNLSHNYYIIAFPLGRTIQGNIVQSFYHKKKGSTCALQHTKSLKESD